MCQAGIPRRAATISFGNPLLKLQKCSHESAPRMGRLDPQTPCLLLRLGSLHAELSLAFGNRDLREFYVSVSRESSPFCFAQRA